MFKVHKGGFYENIRFNKISKHFMFKVHASGSLKKIIGELFQNISCLRFMTMDNGFRRNRKIFQNISCLRFI